MCRNENSFTFSSQYSLQVYVIDERKQLVMVLDSKPTDVEHDMESITKYVSMVLSPFTMTYSPMYFCYRALYNATGYDVRVRKLEPHSERNQIDYSA